jgi:hypothetical protein
LLYSNLETWGWIMLVWGILVEWPGSWCSAATSSDAGSVCSPRRSR